MQLVAWADLGIAGALSLFGLLMFHSALARRHRRRKEGRGDPAALLVSGLSAVMVATGLFLLALSFGIGALISPR